ncbi:hypothetical protein L873DRAFT_1232412 [Choiromyces venosus 120613-1]|uniref:Uncharacterized protein n=1 Tax=Choiromyces venosus 120613-1 TaxID=1336337 RepID=A0A3N4JHN8_9PEZI|nr:hypothetical protein L873DRAFT_1232412 [Choiromyces venosus 120613-1]
MHSPIHLLSLTFSLTLLLSGTAYCIPTEGEEVAHSVTQELYQWPISAESPTPLCELWYDYMEHWEDEYRRWEDASCSFGRDTKSCAMTGECGDSEIVRVGIKDEEGVFRGVATTGKALKDNDKISIVIRRNRDAPSKIWRVELQRVDNLQQANVRATTQDLGPQPILNKPIILNAEGKLPEPVVEKTFLQKYPLPVLQPNPTFYNQQLTTNQSNKQILVGPPSRRPTSPIRRWWCRIIPPPSLPSLPFPIEFQRNTSNGWMDGWIEEVWLHTTPPYTALL